MKAHSQTYQISKSGGLEVGIVSSGWYRGMRGMALEWREAELVAARNMKYQLYHPLSHRLNTRDRWINQKT